MWRGPGPRLPPPRPRPPSLRARRPGNTGRRVRLRALEAQGLIAGAPHDRPGVRARANPIPPRNLMRHPMIDLNDVDPTLARAQPERLPATRTEARARLIAIDDGIATIRTQIATADLKRQASRTPIDPDWFHRAKTALRHLERERAELRAAMIAALPGRKDRLKDHIIAVGAPGLRRRLTGRWCSRWRARAPRRGGRG